MDDQHTAVGAVVVDELKRQARESGYLVWTMPKAEAYLYLMYALGILAGYAVARRT